MKGSLIIVQYSAELLLDCWIQPLIIASSNRKKRLSPRTTLIAALDSSATQS